MSKSVKYGILPLLLLLCGLSAAAQRASDPTGAAMSITAMAVVFTALILLYLIFKNIGRLMAVPRKRLAQQALQSTAEKSVSKQQPSADEVYAAIAISLHEYNKAMKKMEHNILTINRVAKVYSPWSSKIYGLRQLPDKKSFVKTGTPQ